MWSDADTAALPTEVARAALNRYTAHLTSDVRTAKRLGLPLGSTVQVDGDLLGITPEAPSPAQVLFNLKLPVLRNVSVRDLLELRESQREYFDRFRLALRMAATERLASGQQENAAAAASAIEQDVIAPALQDIELHLRAAADTLGAKTRTTTPVAALLTACGVFASEPLLITGGSRRVRPRFRPPSNTRMTSAKSGSPTCFPLAGTAPALSAKATARCPTRCPSTTVDAPAHQPSITEPALGASSGA